MHVKLNAENTFFPYKKQQKFVAFVKNKASSLLNSYRQIHTEHAVPLRV